MRRCSGDDAGPVQRHHPRNAVMLARRTQIQKPTVLLVHSSIGTDTGGGRACRMLVEEFANRNIEAITAAHFEDARAVIVSDASIRAVMIDWSMPDEDGKTNDNATARQLIETVRDRNDRIPIFLLTAARQGQDAHDRDHRGHRRAGLAAGGRLDLHLRPRAGGHAHLHRIAVRTAHHGDVQLLPGPRILLAYARATPAAPPS